MNYKFPSKLFSWYYTSIISIILLFGFGATLWTYQDVSRNAKKELLLSVASISYAFNPNDIISLTGTELDLNNPYHISIKNRLEKIREINKDVRFVYLLGYRENQIYFMIDSEPATSLDYSPPGQIYEEATLVEKQVLLKELPSAIEFNKDRWGNWFTALVPIMDGEKVIAVIGMDMNSGKYLKNIYIPTAIPFITTIFVLLLIVVGLVLRKNEEKYLELKENLVSLATHELRSPLTGISWLLDIMLGEKDNIKSEERTNLEDVNGRIKSLLKSVNELLASHNKKDVEK